MQSIIVSVISGACGGVEMAFLRLSKAIWGTLLLAGVAAGCLDDVVLVMPPPPPTGTVTLKVRPPSDDTATAHALGWTQGIPGARVLITPADGSGPAREFTSSINGEVIAQDIRLQEHYLEVDRMLSASERSALSPGDDATAFLLRGRLFPSFGAAIGLHVPANRTRSLIISEWAFNVTAKGYQDGGFLELHNNADTTIYLDGLLIARGFDLNLDAPNFPCSAYTHITGDSTSIWVRMLDAFPGRGRDHPLAPGGTVAIATDAIDHRPLDPQAIDLRAAAFEFIGMPDVDNPAVPNMVHHGTITIDHGIKWGSLGSIVAVILPLDVDALPRAKPRPESATEWLRVPRTSIVDVLWIRSNYTASEYRECPRLVHSVFDRDGANMRGTDEFKEADYSISRRRFGGTSAVRLQHTRTGSADFVRTSRTPGTPD